MSLEPESVAGPPTDLSAAWPARSRRGLLSAAVGGLAATIAAALGRPAPASAAAGSNLVIGSQANNAGTSDTQLIANSSVIAFKLLQQGPGTALMGHATQATGATRGVYGRTDSPNGYGVQARNAGVAEGSGAAIQAIGGTNTGLQATSDNFHGAAVDARHSDEGVAVWATTTLEGTAIVAQSASGNGIESATGGGGIGVSGSSSSGIGVDGFSPNGTGVKGRSSSYIGVWGHSNSFYGVVGSSGVLAGVYGSSDASYGVTGTSNGNAGVYGTSINGWGVGGISANNAGVYGASTSSYAGYFNGPLWGQSLNASAKAFRIDHPQDPANKVLVHSCVESNERKLVYDGLTTTDAKGEATIELPGYFEALNRDVRYQLTVVGSFAQAVVQREVAGGRFTIATSEPRTKVSWQVTGVRQDAYAKAHPLEVEGLKTGHEKGRYLAPAEHGQPASAGVAVAMGSGNRPTEPVARPA